MRNPNFLLTIFILSTLISNAHAGGSTSSKPPPPAPKPPSSSTNRQSSTGPAAKPSGTSNTSTSFGPAKTQSPPSRPTQTNFGFYDAAKSTPPPRPAQVAQPSGGAKPDQAEKATKLFGGNTSDVTPKATTKPRPTIAPKTTFSFFKNTNAPVDTKTNSDGSETHRVVMDDGSKVVAGSFRGMKQYEQIRKPDGTTVHLDYRTNKRIITDGAGVKKTFDLTTNKIIKSAPQVRSDGSYVAYSRGREVHVQPQVIGTRTIYVNDHRNSITDHPLFWYWMLSHHNYNPRYGYYGDGPNVPSVGDGYGGSSLPTAPAEAKPVSFTYNWKNLFSSLPDGIPTEKKYDQDGINWISDYTVYSLLNSNSEVQHVYKLGWFRKHCWLLCGPYSGSWEQNGYYANPATYDMGGAAVTAILKEEVASIARALSSKDENERKILSVKNFIDEETKTINRDYLFVVDEDREVYDSALATFHLHDGDVIQIHHGGKGDPDGVEATIVYAYNPKRSWEKQQVGKAFTISIDQIQEMHNELINGVDLGISAGVEESQKGHIPL